MHKNNRRGPRGDPSTGAAVWRRRAWTLALAAPLIGCQSLSSVPSSSGPAPAEPPPPTPIEAEPLVLSVVRGPGLRLDGLETQTEDGDEAPDLVVRIRDGLALPQSDDPAVGIELDWFLAHPDYLSRVLSRSDSYLYHIVEELERRGMPLDLALLPVIESAFDPFAYSHGRAAGLWQIIPGTGRRLGLKQNWWYDARRDILESTRGALDYLQQLNDLFEGDWLLALAGYNSGEGNVSRAIRRAQTAGEPADFWHIRRYLPRETRTYVPRLLAVQQLVGAPAALGVKLPAIPDEPRFQIIATGGQIDMALAAEVAGVSTDELYRLNPGVNRWATDPDGPHRILIPVANAGRFSTAIADLGNRQRVRWTRHRVRAGDTLGEVAFAYQTTPAVLQEVNGLRNDMIRIGQNLMVPHAVGDLSEYTQSVDARTARTQSQPREGQRQSHTVRAGDSLWSISRRYDVEVRELARWNAMAPGDVLSVGRRLVVWSDSGTTGFAPAAPRTERIRRLDYPVRRGDSLSLISTRFRVSVSNLLEWNDLSSDQYLQPGQRLIVYVDVTEQST